MGERREFPQGVCLGQSPGGNAFWRISKVTELSLLHLYVDALSSSNSALCHIRGQGRGLGDNSPCPNVEPRLDVPTNYYIYSHKNMVFGLE